MNSERVSWFLFFTPKETVLALPSWTAPRILIVNRSLQQRWRDSSAFYPAFRLRAKLVKLLIRLAVTCCPSLFLRKKRRYVSGQKHPLAECLHRFFPSFKQSAIAYSLFSDYFISIGVLSENEYIDCTEQRGTLVEQIHHWFPPADRVVLLSGAASDPKQKLVAKVLNRHGKAIGYVKFGEKELARHRVENEAMILQKLPKGTGPDFRGLEKSDCFICFAMSAMNGSMPEAKLPALTTTDPLHEIRHYLTLLQNTQTVFDIDQHPAIIRLRKGAECSSSPNLRTLDFDKILLPLRTPSWPTVIQHSDFTPWNILRQSPTPNDLCAIDWEEGITDGFPNFDLIYYILQTAYFMHHWSAGQTFNYTATVLSKALMLNGQRPAPAIINTLIRLAALDAWLAGERGGLAGNPLQHFRLSIILLNP